MRALCVIVLVAGIALVSLAIAQPAQDAGPAAPTSVDAGALAAAAPARGDDLSAELDKLRQEVDAYRKAKKSDDGVSTEKKLALFGLLASLTWTLCAGLKKVAGKVGKPKLARWLPLVALALGPVAGFLSSKADGIGTIDAFLLGAGPPLAVLLHELGEMLWGRGKEGSPPPTPTPLPPA